MGLLDMSDKEFELRQRELTEAVKLIGQDALLYPVLALSEDINSDKKVTYDKPHKVGVIFESNPRPILKKFEWLTEDEDLPYIVYLVPFDHAYQEFMASEQMLIQILSRRVLESERFFKVTHVRGVSIDPLMWICKVVPHRPKIDTLNFPDAPHVEVGNSGETLPSPLNNETITKPHSDVGNTYLRRRRK